MTAAVPAFSPSLPELPALIDGLPNICGWESAIEAATLRTPPPSRQALPSKTVVAGFAIALHMHQPVIPAGPDGKLISYLQYMFEHAFEHDNHQAGSLLYCYGRLGDFIPELVSQGCQPRILLDCSGTLLWGLQDMGRQETLAKLKRITGAAAYQSQVEWLGTFWSYAPASRIPLPDLKLQVRAWQHHFAAIFGLEALGRVQGFSLPAADLPSDSDALYALVETLRTCGYRWLMVTQASLEQLIGQPLAQPHLPHRLEVTNRAGETVAFTLLINQAADADAVSQMQPYTLAKHLAQTAASPLPLVMQSAPSESSAMMNRFPGSFKRAWHDLRSQPQVAGLTGSEYLDALAATGFNLDDYPVCSVAATATPPTAIPETFTNTSFKAPLSIATSELRHRLSAHFHRSRRNIDGGRESAVTRQPRYREALLYNLLLQASCFRSGQTAPWSSYAREIYARGERLLR
ncbi:glycosyl hydrolase family 57 [Sphaerothrix gracilis]|uniref:glycosyl hydrolase family 57 n=1 Tax=Sphaerothrix gracilis TaxID=3151835 RepID=UPI0031FCECD6